MLLAVQFVDLLSQCSSLMPIEILAMHVLDEFNFQRVDVIYKVTNDRWHGGKAEHGSCSHPSTTGQKVHILIHRDRLDNSLFLDRRNEFLHITIVDTEAFSNENLFQSKVLQFILAVSFD